MRVEIFRTVCRDCGIVYDRLTWPTSAWGPIFFATQGGLTGLLDPDADPFWEAVVELAPNEKVGHWRFARYWPHDAAVEAAVDPAPASEAWYIWGMVPCPQCGSRDVLSDDPYEPVRVTEIEPVAVQHRGWDGLSATERRKLIERVVASRPPR